MMLFSGKTGSVDRLTILSKICKTLNADFGDIVEYVPDGICRMKIGNFWGRIMLEVSSYIISSK